MTRLRFVLALAVLAVWAAISKATTLEGRVVAVSDGDTITVITSFGAHQKIRFAGIDASERGQPFSNRSKQNLSDLVFGKNVVVDYNKIDRYGR